MRVIIRRVVVTLTTLAATLALSAGVAQADGKPGGGPNPDAAKNSVSTKVAQGSGYLYAWEAADYGGRACWWFNASTNWDNIAGDSLNACSGGSRASMRNKASTVWNDGNSGRPVNLYIHPSYTGAWACLPVQHTPRTRMRHELARLNPGAQGGAALADLAAGRPAAIRRLGATMKRYFQVALQPHWDTISATVAGDRALRGAKVLSGGAGQMLEDLGPTVLWDPPVLSIAGYPSSRKLDLGGRGITLIPSHFCWNFPIALADPELQPVLVYPALRRRGASTPPQHDLAALLGRTRLAVLRLTTHGATTTDLARRAMISPASASEHATVLRNAGLITSRRHGNLMLHQLSGLGSRLLAGPHP